MNFAHISTIPIPPGNERAPLVQTALNELHALMEGLQGAVESLEARLSPVLSITPLQGASIQKEGPRPALPPLVESIHGVRERIVEADRRLREIADRVEV